MCVGVFPTLPESMSYRIVSYRIVSLYLSGLAGIGEATAFGGREGLGHRFAAAWARVRAASGDG